MPLTVSEDGKDVAFTLNGKRQACTDFLFLKGELKSESSNS